MTKFSFGFWNYSSIRTYTPDDIDVWVECGMTMPMLGIAGYNEEDLAHMRAMLDRAQERGIKAIGWVSGWTNATYRAGQEEQYKADFRKLLEKISHPALHGLVIGDEPGDPARWEEYGNQVRMQREVAPELHPYLNLSGHSHLQTVEQIGGKTYAEWLAWAADSGMDYYCMDYYDQMWTGEGREAGTHGYFASLYAQNQITRTVNLDVWHCLLSSAHYMQQIPTEYDIAWQINTAAAFGSRGIIWFRFYDRVIAPNYHGSPIDAYGNKTPLYYSMLRQQRYFNDQYGELLGRCRSKGVYMTHKPYGGVPSFGFGTHPIIQDISGTTPAIVSFFEDDEGKNYLCMVNISRDEPGVYRVFFDREKYKLVESQANGKRDANVYSYGHTKEHWDGEWLYPGQMILYRIDEK